MQQKKKPLPQVSVVKICTEMMPLSVVDQKAKTRGKVIEIDILAPKYFELQGSQRGKRHNCESTRNP